MSRRNPKTGKHPDLFGGSTPSFVPLEDLTREQIVELPRSAFTEEEWESLDSDTQDEIYENDRASQKRVEELSNFLKLQHWIALDTDVDKDTVGEDLEYWLDAEAQNGSLLDSVSVSDDAESEFAALQARGYTEDQINDALLNALRNISNWVVGSRGEFRNDYAANLCFDSYDVPNREELFRSDIPRAIDNLPHGVDLYEVDDVLKVTHPNNDRGWDALDYSIDNARVGHAAVNWDYVISDVRGELMDLEPETEYTPDEEIELELPNGYVWWKLQAKHLPREGEMLKHCVGDIEQGYIEATVNGEMVPYSLRSPSGKRILTAAIDVEEGMKPVINQIKGKYNRLPGFADMAADGPMIKPEEFAMALWLADHLGAHPFTCADTDRRCDLDPGWRELAAGRVDKKAIAKVHPKLWAVVEEYVSRMGMSVAGPFLRDNPIRTFDDPYARAIATRKNPGHRFLPLSTVKRYEKLAADRGVSSVARSPRGFLTAYKRAGSASGLPSDWLDKREAFIARHTAQMNANREPLWETWRGQRVPTRRHLALIMWAYSPTRV